MFVYQVVETPELTYLPKDRFMSPWNYLSLRCIFQPKKLLLSEQWKAWNDILHVHLDKRVAENEQKEKAYGIDIEIIP